MFRQYNWTLHQAQSIRTQFWWHLKLFDSTLSKESGLKRKCNAYIWDNNKKKGTERNRKKSQWSHEKKLALGSIMSKTKLLPQVDVSGQTNMCNETQQKQANCLRDLISKFHRIVKKGPVNVCCCCDQLWYKHSSVFCCKTKRKTSRCGQVFTQQKKCWRCWMSVKIIP